MNCCELLTAQLAAVLRSVGVRVAEYPTIDVEPVTLEEAWAHLRIDAFPNDDSPPALESDDDFWLTNIGIPGARAWAEGYLGLTVAPATLEWSANGFPDTIELPFGPVREIVSVTYADEDDVDQTADPLTYVFNPYATPATLKPVDDWPAAYDKDRSVRVQYVAGYSDDSPATPMPPDVKIGILLMLGHLYENRESNTSATISAIPDGARTFLDNQRVRFGFA